MLGALLLVSVASLFSQENLPMALPRCGQFKIVPADLRFRSLILKSRLEAENAALRHQLIVLRRKMQGRVRVTNSDRWFFVQVYRWFPSILQVLTIIRPETLVRCLLCFL